MPLNTADPRAPDGTRISHFFRGAARRIARAERPGGSPAQIFHFPHFPGRRPGFAKVQGDPHSANFACQNRETALQMSR